MLIQRILLWGGGGGGKGAQIKKKSSTYFREGCSTSLPVFLRKKSNLWFSKRRNRTPVPPSLDPPMSQCDENLQNTVIVVVIQKVHLLYHHHQHHHVFNNLIISIQFMQYFQCNLFKSLFYSHWRFLKKGVLFQWTIWWSMRIFVVKIERLSDVIC